MIYILKKDKNDTTSNYNSTDTGTSLNPRPSHLINPDDLYLNISGSIEMINSFGYLNAEIYPLITYYLWMGLLLSFVGMLWTYVMLKH
jgi:hypothetical protein